MADPVLPLIIERKAAKAAGLKRYYTGRACCAGHVAERRVSTGTCLDCSREFSAVAYATQTAESLARQRAVQAKYRKANPEKQRASGAAYREANREKVLDAGRVRYKANAERLLAEKAEFYRRNVEKMRARARVYHEANRIKRCEYSKAWAKANPEKARNLRRQHKARRRGAEGSHTRHDVAEILAMQKGKCALCKVKVGKDYQVDHIQPVSKGGSNWPRNLQILCRPCNSKKRAKDPIQFAQELGLLL